VIAKICAIKMRRLLCPVVQWVIKSALEHTTVRIRGPALSLLLSTKLDLQFDL
jgi:hypothetical protein